MPTKTTATTRHPARREPRQQPDEEQPDHRQIKELGAGRVIRPREELLLDHLLGELSMDFHAGHRVLDRRIAQVFESDRARANEDDPALEFG